jgi:hypothetical protein
VARRGKKVAAVALDNKNARMAWRLISEGSSTNYKPPRNRAAAKINH